MSDYTPPAEAVEAAAKALMRANADGLPEWDDLDPQEREYWCSEATAALTAAGPIIAAEVERLRGVERGWQHDRSEWEKERDEARQQLADLRAGIETAVATLNREVYRQPTPWIDRLANRLRALLAGGEA